MASLRRTTSCAPRLKRSKRCIRGRTAGAKENGVKLALFEKDADILPGVITDAGIVNVAHVVPLRATPQLTMTGIIDDFDRLRPALERRAQDGIAVPLE